MSGTVYQCMEQPAGHVHLDAGQNLVRRGMRRIRYERGWSTAYAARLFGWTTGHLSRVERGVRVPPDAAVAAKALGVTPRYLTAPCGHCHYQPPPGFICARCGSEGDRIRFVSR